jgi:predicted TIM-barrel fold metal-dependent hydrolase
MSDDEKQKVQQQENQEDEEAEIAACKKHRERQRILAGLAYHTSPEDREAWRRHIKRQSKLGGCTNPSKGSPKKT